MEEEEENYQHLVGGRTKSSCVIRKKKAVKNGELYSSSLNNNFTVDNIQLEQQYKPYWIDSCCYWTLIRQEK